MRNGTQEELDVAMGDARLIPEDALFKISENSVAWTNENLESYGMAQGDYVFRSGASMADAGSVAFIKSPGGDVVYFGADDLEPI